MTPREMQTDDLSYPWPTNLEAYEPKIFLGLTATEAMAGAMAFLVPIALLQSAAGFFLGALAAVLAVLALKKVERFDGLSPLAFLLVWLREQRREVPIVMPLVSAQRRSTLRFADADGKLVSVLAGEGEVVLPWSQRGEDAATAAPEPATEEAP